MPATATRLFTLITLLQRRPGQKAGDLAGELGVSVRTLHRYFGMLDEMGIPIFAERGPNGGFSLVRGYKLPPLIFTPEEAVAVHLGTSLVGEMWGSLYRESATGALAKVESVLPDEQRAEVAWARRSLVVAALHRADPTALFPLLEDLRRAIHEKRRVSAVYRSASDPKETQRQIDPYALVFRAGLWYLVGHCHLRGGPRTFRVDRIRSLSILAQEFQLPAEFDVHAHLQGEFKDQPIVRATFRFAPEAAHIVAGNLILWESVLENPDGSSTVTLAAPDLTWLASMALSFANLVTVLEPPELREMVRSWARAILELYP